MRLVHEGTLCITYRPSYAQEARMYHYRGGTLDEPFDVPVVLQCLAKH